MKLIDVQRSDRQGKKYVALFSTDKGRTKSTHFGDSNMEDYTQHHDKERRERYRSRHQKDLKTDDPTRAGYLSYYLLWGDSKSLKKNIATYKQLFNL